MIEHINTSSRDILWKPREAEPGSELSISKQSPEPVQLFRALTALLPLDGRCQSGTLGFDLRVPFLIKLEIISTGCISSNCIYFTLISSSSPKMTSEDKQTGEFDNSPL